MTLHIPRLPFPLDPLIAEAKRRMRRRRLLAAVAVVAAVAGGAYALVAHGGGARAPRLSPFAASTTYSVVASVIHVGSVRGKPLEMACLTSDLTLPPHGCGGVPVTGYSFGRISGDVRYPGGIYETPMLRLVGTWGGKVLRVSGASHASLDQQTIPAQPDCLAHRTGAMVRPSAQAIAKAGARVHILQAGPCGHTYSFVVAVADFRTVSYLERQFGKTILVTGWLQPAHQ